MIKIEMIKLYPKQCICLCLTISTLNKTFSQHKTTIAEIIAYSFNAGARRKMFEIDF